MSVCAHVSEIKHVLCALHAFNSKLFDMKCVLARICFRPHFPVCISSAHKSLFVPILCVCSFIPASVEPRAHLAPMRAAASRCLSLIHGCWTASAAIPLPPFYITYLSLKTHSAYLPAPAALPPTDKRGRDALFLGRILQEMSTIICICLRPSALQNPCLFLIWELFCKAIFVFSSPFAFSQGLPILP